MNATAEAEKTLWMVVRQDTNGARYLVEGAKDLTESEAEARIERFARDQTKPHKMDYYKQPYTRKTYGHVLVTEEIRY
jgi:hypothetical protein